MWSSEYGSIVWEVFNIKLLPWANSIVGVALGTVMFSFFISALFITRSAISSQGKKSGAPDTPLAPPCTCISLLAFSSHWLQEVATMANSSGVQDSAQQRIQTAAALKAFLLRSTTKGNLNLWVRVTKCCFPLFLNWRVVYIYMCVCAVHSDTGMHYWRKTWSFSVNQIKTKVSKIKCENTA